MIKIEIVSIDKSYLEYGLWINLGPLLQSIEQNTVLWLFCVDSAPPSPSTKSRRSAQVELIKTFWQNKFEVRKWVQKIVLKTILCSSHLLFCLLPFNPPWAAGGEFRPKKYGRVCVKKLIHNMQVFLLSFRLFVWALCQYSFFAKN